MDHRTRSCQEGCRSMLEDQKVRVLLRLALVCFMIGVLFAGIGPAKDETRAETASDVEQVQDTGGAVAPDTVTGSPGTGDHVLYPGADINGDGCVDYRDLAILGASCGCCVGDPCYNPDADINQDGCVDHKDLAILGAWYDSCLVVEVCTDKQTYGLGEPVQILISVTNSGPDTTLEFDSSCLADYRVLGQTHTYHFLAHMYCLMVMTDLPIGSGETVQLLNITWSQVDDNGNAVPPGAYCVDGWMVGGLSHADVHGGIVAINIVA